MTGDEQDVGGTSVAGARAPTGAMSLAESGPVNGAVATLGRLHRQLAGTILRRAGVYPGQEFLLAHLSNAGECVQSDLVASQGVDPSTIAKGLQRMEAQGTISRRKSTTDRRATIVALTADGKALCQEVDALWKELERKTTAGLSERQVRDALKVLRRLNANCAEALERGDG